MAGQSGNPGGAVGIIAPSGPVRGLFRPVRGLVRARPWPARTPKPGIHGRMADGGGPQSCLETHKRRSAGCGSGGASVL
jgi:hypothetical protein